MANFLTVDIGEKYIKIADVSKKGDLINLDVLASDVTPVNVYQSDSEKDSSVVVDIITKLIKDSGSKKKNASIIIPDSHSYSQILEMPSITEKELLSAIRYQADQFIPIPIEKVNLDIEILYENKKEKKLLILLVAAPLTLLDKVSLLVESAGLNPGFIENEVSASLRVITMLQKVRKITQPELYVNFSSTATTLYFLGPKGEGKTIEYIPLQIRNFPIGLDIFAKDIRINFNLSDKDAYHILQTVGLSGAQSPYDLEKILVSPTQEFIQEIQKFISSIKNQYDISISALNVFGEGFKMVGLTQKMSQILNVPTKLFTLYEYSSKNNVSDFFKNDLPLFLPTIGGALADDL